MANHLNVNRLFQCLSFDDEGLEGHFPANMQNHSCIDSHLSPSVLRLDFGMSVSISVTWTLNSFYKYETDRSTYREYVHCQVVASLQASSSSCSALVSLRSGVARNLWQKLRWLYSGCIHRNARSNLTGSQSYNLHIVVEPKSIQIRCLAGNPQEDINAFVQAFVTVLLQ